MNQRKGVESMGSSSSVLHLEMVLKIKKAAGRAGCSKINGELFCSSDCGGENCKRRTSDGQPTTRRRSLSNVSSCSHDFGPIGTTVIKSLPWVLHPCVAVKIPCREKLKNPHRIHTPYLTTLTDLFGIRNGPCKHVRCFEGHH